MDVDHPEQDVNQKIAAASAARSWSEVVAVWIGEDAQKRAKPDTYLKVASAYRELGKLDDADQVLVGGVKRFPDSLALHTERAWFDLKRGRHVESLDRWETVIRQFPNDAVGVIGYAAALRDLRRYAIADIMLLGGKIRFPGSVRMWTDYARNAQFQGRTDEAMIRFREMITVFPSAPVGYRGVAELLRNSGQLDEAVEVLEQGLAVLPKNLELRTFHAWLATYRREWDEAEARWQYLKDNYPLTPDLSRDLALGLGEVKMGRGLDAIDVGEAGPQAVVRAVNAGSDTSLFERWESMGYDCEFGLLQRHFGIEPISLLRWTSTTIEQLTNAFEQDFDGVGILENTEVGPHNGEWLCGDKRFGLLMHTFIRTANAEEGPLRVTMANRMLYLRRKLLEDLEDCERSYVYKAGTAPSDEMVLGLHKAMQKRGPNRLLVVVKAEGDQAPNTIRELGPGVAMGYIREFGNRPGAWDIDVGSWTTLCTLAEQSFGI